MTWLIWFRPQKMSIIRYGWMDDIRKWPQVEHVDIYNHLILSRASNGKEIKSYHSMDSNDYFQSGSVGKFFNSTHQKKSFF